MLTLEDIRREKRGISFYVLPGRRTTECAKHAAEVLDEINTLTYRAESEKTQVAKGTCKGSSASLTAVSS